MTIVEDVDGKQRVVETVRIPNEIPDSVLLRIKR
jgi:hypothetical protein